jgi:RNA polymerase sigma-70 factor (ECF subfamily)
VAEAQDARAGLAIVDALDLGHYHPFHAARGDLLTWLARADEARDAFRAALDLDPDDAERRSLEQRLAALDAPATGSGCGTCR